MSFDEMREAAAAYYAEKLAAHGPVPQGVDWNSPESQALRFAQLLKVVDAPAQTTLLDYGCGYGALAETLAHTFPEMNYVGYDAAPQMVATARKRHARSGAIFTAGTADLQPADFVVASGLFNVKQHYTRPAWTAYVLEALERFHMLAKRGFAFNVLTKYADPERMRPDLYYADPCFFFDYCKSNFSRWVALLHDYGLYEFTVIVRRDEEGRATPQASLEQ